MSNRVSIHKVQSSRQSSGSNNSAFNSESAYLHLVERTVPPVKKSRVPAWLSSDRMQLSVAGVIWIAFASLALAHPSDAASFFDSFSNPDTAQQPVLSRGKFLDHDSVLAMGGVGNLVEPSLVASSYLRTRTHQEAGQVAPSSLLAPTSLASSPGLSDDSLTTSMSEPKVNASDSEDRSNSEVGNYAAGAEDGDAAVKQVIYFDVADSNLDRPAEIQLSRVAQFLKSDPNLQAEVDGYTDSVGDPLSNREMAAERAHTVASELISLGVPAEQLKSYSYGASEPEASNQDEEGRAKNRRVEIYIEDLEND